MKSPILAGAAMLALFLIICLTGCQEDRQPQHADLVTPPAAAGVSIAQQDLMTQQAAATARAQVDLAKLKADLAEQAKQQALAASAHDAQARATAEGAAQAAAAAAAKDRADRDQALADASALRAQGEQTAKAQTKASFTRFYFVGLLGLILAAFLLKEGMVGKAGTVAAISGACLIAPSVGNFVVDHDNLILAAVSGTFIAFLLYHFRSKIQAAITAIAHLHGGQSIETAEGEVKTMLIAGWAKLKGLEHKVAVAVLAMVHHGSSAAANPTVVASPKPAAPPAPASFEKG